MANVTVLNGNSSTVGGASLFTASSNTRLLIAFIHSTGSSTITMRWGHSVNYNQVTSSDVHAIGSKLAQIRISNDDANSAGWGSAWGGYRLTKGFLSEYTVAGMTTTMAYPLQIYLKSGEIFDLTCGAYSISVITE